MNGNLGRAIARLGFRLARRNTPSAESVRRADQLLRVVDRRLRKAYGTASLGNKADPLDELIYIQLSIRTPEDTYADIYLSLHGLVRGNWEEILHRSDEEILAVLRGGGMAAVKLDRLRGQIARITNAFGRATLAPLHAMSDEEAEDFLLSLPGVGPKAARCVLMYSLGRAVFPVDSHCLRVLRRLGVAPPDLDRKAAHDFLQPIVPLPIRHTLHVNLVHHGRLTCTPANPRCRACPILDVCIAGRTRAPAGR